MKIEEAIKWLQRMINSNERYKALLARENGNGVSTALHGTELELEALRMAKRALEEKPRWIPFEEQPPQLHEYDHCGEIVRVSETVLFCNRTGVHVGSCEIINDRWVWETKGGLTCNDVAAWMPLPEMYVYEED